MSYAGDLYRRSSEVGVPWDALLPFLAQARSGDTAAEEIVLVSSAVLICRQALHEYRRWYGRIDFDDCVAVCVDITKNQAIPRHDGERRWAPFCEATLRMYSARRMREIAANIYIPEATITSDRRARKVRQQRIHVLQEAHPRTIRPRTHSHVESMTESVGNMKSIDAPIARSHGALRKKECLADILPAQESSMPRYSKEDPEVQNLDRVLDMLPRACAYVLRLRYGIGVGISRALSLAEVAAKMGRTRLAIRMIEAEGLRLLEGLRCALQTPRPKA